MGMAASQARYLALVARKSNCEYEGQQINQARTALSNQSANLFNQMLGLQVPIPPSKQDFTTSQYSYTDGINASTISSWQQLSAADPNYNYVVTHYYYTDRFTGSQKKLSDPQVQFSSTTPATVSTIHAAAQLVETTKQAYEDAVAVREQEEANLSTLESHKMDGYGGYTSTQATNGYTLSDSSGNSITFKKYDNNCTNDYVNNFINNYTDLQSRTDLYYYEKNGVCQVTTEDELKNKVASNDISYYEANLTALTTAKNAEATAKTAYDNAVAAYDALGKPTYVGNSELTYQTDFTVDQQAEINQILRDMEEQGINSSIANCFDANGNYLGGIYTFKLNGTTYYTTYDDLEASYTSGTGNNNIDGQTKLTYYNASYISTKIEETEKALLETDGNGRFTSVRFENDTVTYTLNMETVTDDDAYEDAMNQYYYENAIYDKTIQDINAQTSIIQQQDQQLELRLKQLDTEQNALSTEIDAVQKVVKDNVEKSFKTFGG